jgi:hypothetical protein
MAVNLPASWCLAGHASRYARRSPDQFEVNFQGAVGITVLIGTFRSSLTLLAALYAVTGLSVIGDITFCR